MQQRDPQTVSQLLAQMRESQDKVNSLSDAREFHDPETAGSSGASHVTRPPLAKPSYRTVPRRDSGLPPETLNMMGISDVFWTTTCSRRTTSKYLEKSRNLASFSRGVKPKLTEHTMTTGSKRRPEQQDLSNSRNILHCGDGISRHIGGTYSHVGMMEYPRFPISELHLAKFPDSMNLKAGKSISRLKFVRRQRILKSRCYGSQKLRKQSQLTNRVHRNQFLGEQISQIVKCWMYW